MEHAPKHELSEKDFINEDKKPSFPTWIWLSIVTSILALFWGLGSLYQHDVKNQVDHSPFLQVTNRQLSVFLWQHPNLMRVNARNKSAYLPGFQFLDKISLEIPMTEQYAVAPPEVLFLYHTWNRLIGNFDAKRIIKPEEFHEFLNYAQEWLPENWPGAPIEYKKVVISLDKPSLIDRNLQLLSEASFPLIVRQAFQGWKNYFKEGEMINKIRPTYQEMQEFLQENPNFARNFWRNIVVTSSPNYLKSLQDGFFHIQEVIPRDELDPFLNVSFYNYQQAKLEHAHVL